MTVLRTAAIALAILAAAPGAGAAAAKHHAPTCAPPRSVSFQRSPGGTAGTLSWRAPRRAPKGTRYRVSRDRSVVGQTKRLRMRVRVSVGRSFKFTVRVVDPKGRPTRCQAKLRQNMAYVRPSQPGLLTASGAGSAAVHLTWAASQRGEAPLKAYRVTRDGAVYRQLAATAIDVPIANDKTYSFRVTAVDANGQLSDASAEVVVDSGHAAPPAPAGLSGTPSGEASVDLAWQPSVPARGRVAGYRVYRDGLPVRQVPDTALRVANLGAQSTHTFTVAAVDASGWISAPSAPATVSTTPPEQTRGFAHAFLLASTDRSFEDFRAHYRQIGTVYPTYYDCDPARGTLVGSDNPQITGWAQARGVKVLPRVNCQSGAVIDALLHDQAARGQWLDDLTALVDANGYDGLNIDFEAGYAADRDLYTAFIGELAQRLHARGKLLSVAASAKARDIPNHPRSTFFDYIALSRYADHIFVMAWGFHWASSTPGAQDDMRWVRDVVAYLKTMPDPSRFVLGTHLYGMDWPSGGGPQHLAGAHEYAEVMAIAAQFAATPVLDPAQDAWHLAYTDAGVPHDVWYEDATTLADRFQLAHDAGIGVGFWRLGNEDQRMWDGPWLAPGFAWATGG